MTKLIFLIAKSISCVETFKFVSILIVLESHSPALTLIIAFNSLTSSSSTCHVKQKLYFYHELDQLTCYLKYKTKS